MISALSILDNVRIVPSAVDFPRKIRLSDFEDVRETGPEKSGLPRIIVSESLIAGVGSSFLRLADIEVTNNQPKGFRVAWPMRSDQA